MRILVTGGSSFVGAHFCRVAAQSHEVVALHHTTPMRINGVTPLRVDLRRPQDRPQLAAAGADVVVHMACKIRAKGVGDQTPSAAAAVLNRAMMDAVLGLGLPVVYASSTVVHWDQDIPYGVVRREDEARVQQSGLPYLILRPSAPYGPRLASHQPRHKESFHTLSELVCRSPIVPIIGDGQYRRQPVHVDDFSAWILWFLENGLPSQAFDAGGADALSMDAVVDTIADAAGTSPRKLHLPKPLFVRLSKFSRDFDPDLIGAADSDEVADPTALIRATGIRPRRFSDGVRCLL